MRFVKLAAHSHWHGECSLILKGAPLGLRVTSRMEMKAKTIYFILFVLTVLMVLATKTLMQPAV